MANISVNTNLAEVSERLKNKIGKLKDKEYLLRPVCFDLIDLMKVRIHEKGNSAAGTQIGTYSNDYLALRKRGNKKQGIPVRGADPKVIVSLTRQLESDWSVIATERGYGIGFKNKFNLQKARWVEEGKKTSIFALTRNENKYASDFINHLVNQALAND